MTSSGLDACVERWRSARSAFLSLPASDPLMRSLFNELSEAESALFAMAGGMSGPPFEPGSDSAAEAACPHCPRKFFTAASLKQHVRDKHGSELRISNMALSAENSCAA